MRPPLLPTALLALALASAGLGAGRCNPAKPPALRQEYTSIRGLREPHTPGAPGVPIPQKLLDLHGKHVDLNQVHFVRTWLDRAPVRPDTILILIPGFLGGATTFDPLARDLVEAGGGRIEVWAVDRRPNQLEDRLGALHAAAGAEQGDPDAIFEGAQFYFPDTDGGIEGVFPEPGDDFDLDLDGDFDPQLPLEDAFGAVRGPIFFEQDDVRFAAHWGIDLYMRDWKILVEHARRVVHKKGRVIFGGHSQGTAWASIFAAYDFDPGAQVEAGHQQIDGLILLEGGGIRPPSGTPPTRSEYLDALADLESPGGGEIFMESLVLGGIPVLRLTDLGTIGEVASVAGFFDPGAPALIQRTPIFGSSLLAFLLGAPASNQAIAGLFLDDDFSANPAFRGTLGFIDATGPNFFAAGLGVYIANPHLDGSLRTWTRFDEPLPACPPHTRNDGVGCAINLNVNPGDREVSDIDTFLRTQFEVQNGFEWYFLSGRVSLDFAYGNDSSSLGDESLLAITQNANVAVPVLGIGGGNGLAPSAAAFATYFGSIATPADDKKACILAGYAHVDPLIAEQNEAVPLILDMIDAIASGSPLGPTLVCP